MTLIELVDNRLTDKNTSHSYLDTYEKMFQNKKDKDVNLLEVGIYGGGSMKLWSEYFANGKIYGVDVRPYNYATDSAIRNKKNVKLFVDTNAYDLEFINKQFSETKFDFLIDDGSHLLQDMLFFVEHYSALLKDDGILIVEDVQKWEWIESLKERTPEHLKKYMRVIDLRDVKHQYDDVLFVIDKAGIFA